MRLIKVLVVDDSPVNRRVLSEMLESSPFITVVGVAGDGEEAIQQTVKLKPDLITLDLEMPRMDGFTFLRWLMKSVPVPVIVISSKADDKSVIRALEFGAVDFMPKPLAQGEALDELQFELIDKVKLYVTLEMAKVKSSLAILDQASKAKPLPRKAGQPVLDVVAVGSSTGGPPALQAIITKLPGNFPAAVVVSQHMPANFTRFFAERLDKLSAVEVKEAENGDMLQPGRVLIAPGGSNMTFGRTSGGVSAIIQKPRPEDKYVPSVDIMMKSAALNYGSRVMGVILTGMGNDGKEGMGLISGMGGPTLAESKETAVIYGMPKEAVDAGFVDKVVPLGQIADEIIKACG